MMEVIYPTFSSKYSKTQDNEPIIIVGQSPDVRSFYTHKSVIHDRAPYLAKISSQENENISIKLPDISPKIFGVIYRYLYTSSLDFSEIKTSEIIDILIAAHKLDCQELDNYLQAYLIDKKSYWMEHNFILIHKICSDHDFSKLQNFCKEFIKKSPELIFQLPDFNSISEEMLVSLVKRDDLLLDEAVIWEHVLKWALERNPGISEDPKSWSEEDEKNIKNTLEQCFPHIRFSHLSSQQFYEKAHQCVFRFDPELHDKLLQFYLVPGIKNLFEPRLADINGSLIINNSQFFSHIFSNITKVNNNDIMYEYSSYRSSYSSSSSSYDLKLLLRGSRHGFTPNIFHELCDNKPGTLIIIKVEGKDEILGGYNPVEWESRNGYGCCKSFIFSLRDDNISLSHVDYSERALNYGIKYGPSFGLSDLIISGQNFKYGSRCYCKMDDYKQSIRHTENTFSIEDYEVFQVIKK